jgi:hypothetical protein
MVSSTFRGVLERFGAAFWAFIVSLVPCPGEGDAVCDAVTSSLDGGGGLAVLAFLPPMAPNFDFPLEDVLLLVSTEGSGDMVVSLLLLGGFLPPMIPIFEIACEGVVVLGLGTARADSDSDSVAVSVDGNDNFLETFTVRSGLGGIDFCFVIG